MLAAVLASFARVACETRCKRAGVAAIVAVCALGAFAPSARAQAPAEAPAHERTAPDEHAAGLPSLPADADAHGDTASHDASPWPLIGRIVNFLVLAGVIVYFARTPFSRYLTDRGVQIREDLDRAAAMKDAAGRQIAEIDAKLRLLPEELDALRARGSDEVAAEEARISAAAAAERERLLEQMHREIELQLRIARRDLVTHAADLAVQVARDRIRTRITTDDQSRLVERYLSQVKTND